MLRKTRFPSFPNDFIGDPFIKSKALIPAFVGMTYISFVLKNATLRNFS